MDIYNTSAKHLMTVKRSVLCFVMLAKHIRLKGYSSQRSIYFLLNPFCIKLETIHLSACNFAIVYLYKEIEL